jgi:hypothetical protein
MRVKPKYMTKQQRIKAISAAVKRLDPRVKQQAKLSDMDDAEFIARMTEEPIKKIPTRWRVKGKELQPNTNT